MDIVAVDIPTLLRLDVLEYEKLYSDNVPNRLVHRQVISALLEELAYRDTGQVPLT